MCYNTLMKAMKKSLLIASFIPVLLSSCSYKGPVKTYKNANLLLQEEITYENAFIKFDKTVVESQKTAQYSYMLYISQDGCGLCKDFAPVILEYVKQTHQLVYKIDAIKNPAELDYIADICKDSWFEGKDIVTPTVMVVHGQSSVVPIHYTKFGNINSFTNALRSEISFTNVYMTSSQFDYISACKKLNRDIVYFNINMKNEAHQKLYFNAIKSLVEVANKTIVISDREEYNSVTSIVVKKTNNEPVIESPHTYGDVNADITFLSKVI